MKFLDKLINDDFVFAAINQAHVGPRKRMPGGGFHINCPMCVSRGENPDRRMRCGVKPDLGGVVVHDFNCGFSSRWKPGETISRNMQGFMRGVGVSEDELHRLIHKAFSHREMIQKSPNAIALIPDMVRPTFETKDMPKGAMPFEHWLSLENPPEDFVDVAEYLLGRGDVIASAASYYWTPDPGDKYQMNRRVIVPLTHEGRIVGHTARAVDPEIRPRYHMESRPNYLYNAGALSARNRKYAVLVEGIFDAIAIDGVGLLGAHLNPTQIAWIKSFGKDVILVPDRDKRGAGLIDVALQNNWRVAFPALNGLGQSWWDDGVKDCADAVKLYGRAWTLLSVIESSTANKLEINLKRKLYV